MTNKILREKDDDLFPSNAYTVIYCSLASLKYLNHAILQLKGAVVFLKNTKLVHEPRILQTKFALHFRLKHQTVGFELQLNSFNNENT